MPIPTTVFPDNYANRYTAYIINNVTQKMMILPSMPDGYSESISANYVKQDIVGASRPRIVYVSTGAQQISLSLKNITQSYLPRGYDTLSAYVRAFRALLYPEYRFRNY